MLFSEEEDCEDWTEYLVEEARVKAWKLHKEIYKNKKSESERPSEVKFFRLRPHGIPEKALHRDRSHQLETGSASLIVELPYT